MLITEYVINNKYYQQSRSLHVDCNACAYTLETKYIQVLDMEYVITSKPYQQWRSLHVDCNAREYKHETKYIQVLIAA